MAFFQAVLKCTTKGMTENWKKKIRPCNTLLLTVPCLPEPNRTQYYQLVSIAIANRSAS